MTTSMTPERPASVSANARFGPLSSHEGLGAGEEWANIEGDVWQEGETGPLGRMGPWRVWSPEGRLIQEAGFVDGKMDGVCRNFHDDGTVAWDCVWEQGRRRLVRVFRSENPTTQPFADPEFAQAIWSHYGVYDEEGYQIFQELRDREGRLVDPQGRLAPPRPTNVPETASLLHSSHGSELQWVVSRWDDSSKCFRGLHRIWDPEGRLTLLRYNGQRATCGIDRDGDDEGNPLIVAAREENWDAVDLLFAHGAGASPYAAEHADFEGLHDLAQRVRANKAPDGGMVDPRKEPDYRPKAVANEATWVPGMNGWLRFELEDGKPKGVWTLWKYDEDEDGDYKPETIVVEFSDGRRSLRSELIRGRTLSSQEVFAPDGSARIRRKFDIGTLVEETEVFTDGSVAQREFYRAGRNGERKLESERITINETLVVERWWRKDGTLAAVVGPDDKVVQGKKIRPKRKRDAGHVAFATRLSGDDSDKTVPCERWKAFDMKGALCAEGLVRTGRSSHAIGKWRVLNPDNTWEIVKLSKYKHDRSADLGQFAQEVAIWNKKERSPALAGVDEVPWKKLESCFSGIYRALGFPECLDALAVPGGTVARWGFHQLCSDCLHQESISEVTGPVIRYICQIIAAEEQESPELKAELLEFAIDCASGCRTFWVAREVREVVTRSLKKPLPKAIRAAKDWGYYVEMYRAFADNLPAWRKIVMEAPEEIRWHALHLIAFAPGGEADKTLRELIPVYEKATREGRKEWELAELLLCLGLADVPSDLDVLRGYLRDDRPLIRFAAARTWVRRAGEAAGDALGILLDALTSSELDGFGSCYLAGGDAKTAAAAAISELPTELASRAMDQLCKVMWDAGLLDKVTVSAALLKIAFPEGWDGEAPLTDLQRTAIRAFGDDPSFDWSFVNATEVLRYSGLPETREELRALLSNSTEDPS